MDLSTPIEKIPGIGTKYASKLKKLNIKEVRDLLFHFPSRYEDYSTKTPIKELKKGDMATVEGKIIYTSQRMARNRPLKITEAMVEDSTDVVKAVWFNQGYIGKQLEEGKDIILSGKVSLGKDGLYLSSPTHEFPSTDKAPIHTARVVPIYPETRGVTSRLVRFALSKALPHLQDIEDTLPKKIRDEKDFSSIFNALTTIHFPSSIDSAKEAKRRFEFEELFNIQLAALKTKKELKEESSFKIKTDVDLIKKAVKSLPFTLTDSQKKAVWQILKNMEKPVPMNRLLEGDVGSGKTVVAGLAAVNAVQGGFQAAFMAPTEILAEQHYKTITELLSNAKMLATDDAKKSGVNIALLTSAKTILNGKNAKKPELKKKIADGKVDIVIGTHAVIQKDVMFRKLGFVVIDEQHRFGVGQRAALTKKTGKSKKVSIPHLLSMTATPIPRSLALTVYGDLDITLLKEMPKGRKKIITKIIPTKKRKEAYDLIKKELDKNRQAFVIFPLVDESKKIELKAATAEHKKLSEGPFSDYKVGLLHGKMKSDEKEKVMNKMKKNKIDVLVATSVVEVGIDIPEATVMMIEGAERFGLAQLHQFRGRVGRNEHQSYCLLLSESDSNNTMKRLKALTKAKDGFELAEYDLAFRGPGDVYGTRQSGIPDLAMASLTNVELIEEAREAAQNMLDEDPEFETAPLLKERVEELQKKMHFE
ncbi:MAG: ATP-dependent DNA helicase RecG [Candidatus Spechtbacterales bacterium]|nr:ATP-dependent DNA helicase RecG [Candidatus Spechtbacterales bacterium]